MLVQVPGPGRVSTPARATPRSTSCPRWRCPTPSPLISRRSRKAVLLPTPALSTIWRRRRRNDLSSTLGRRRRRQWADRGVCLILSSDCSIVRNLMTKAMKVIPLREIIVKKCQNLNHNWGCYFHATSRDYLVLLIKTSNKVIYCNHYMYNIFYPFTLNVQWAFYITFSNVDIHSFYIWALLVQSDIDTFI